MGKKQPGDEMLSDALGPQLDLSGSEKPSVNRRFFMLGGMALTLSTVSPSRVSSAENHIDNRFGVNLSVVNVDEEKISSCSVENQHNATFAGHAFLPKYQNQQVRESVKRSLDSLKINGVRSARCLIWFDRKASSSGDVCSIEDSEKIGSNLTVFSNDMLEAGLPQLMVAFSPQAILSPSCRKTTWGDCFSEATLDQTAKFLVDLRKAFSPSKKQILWFDLLNEGAPANSFPLKQQFISYMKHVVPIYRANFPMDKISISLQAGQIGDRMQNLLGNFDEGGNGPDFYSLHLYKTSGDPIKVLRQLLKIVESRPRPFFIGEIEDDPAYYLAADRFLRDVIPNDYQGTLVWPLRDPKNQCAIDTDPSKITFR